MAAHSAADGGAGWVGVRIVSLELGHGDASALAIHVAVVSPAGSWRGNRIHLSLDRPVGRRRQQSHPRPNPHAWRRSAAPDGAIDFIWHGGHASVRRLGRPGRHGNPDGRQHRQRLRPAGAAGSVGNTNLIDGRCGGRFRGGVRHATGRGGVRVGGVDDRLGEVRGVAALFHRSGGVRLDVPRVEYSAHVVSHYFWRQHGFQSQLAVARQSGRRSGGVRTGEHALFGVVSPAPRLFQNHLPVRATPPGHWRCTADKAAKTKEVVAAGAHIIGVHTGLDQQAAGQTPFADLALVAALGLKVEISVAGGVKASTAAQVRDAGATIIVAGAAIYGAADPAASAAEITAIAHA